MPLDEILRSRAKLAAMELARLASKVHCEASDIADAMEFDYIEGLGWRNALNKIEDRIEHMHSEFTIIAEVLK